MRIKFKSSNDSDEQYDAMLILVAIMIIHVIKDKKLFMHSVIVVMYLQYYGMKYYLLTKIQRMLPHIIIKLTVIHTISYQYECVGYCILNNDQCDASGGGDDSDANTDGIADASIVVSPNEMELSLDESDESTMIKQVNESPSTDKASFWLSKIYNTSKRYPYVRKYTANIKSRLKLYLVNEGTDVEKYPNYETALSVKQPVGIKENYLHTFEILLAITLIQIVCSFHLFNHYPNGEHDDTFAFHTNGNMNGNNTNASWGVLRIQNYYIVDYQLTIMMM